MPMRSSANAKARSSNAIKSALLVREFFTPAQGEAAGVDRQSQVVIVKIGDVERRELLRQRDAEDAC